MTVDGSVNLASDKSLCLSVRSEATSEAGDWPALELQPCSSSVMDQRLRYNATSLQLSLHINSKCLSLSGNTTHDWVDIECAPCSEHSKAQKWFLSGGFISSVLSGKFFTACPLRSI